MTVNKSWQLAPWADVLYACDGNWWRRNAGVPDFAGAKVSQDTGTVAAHPEWGVRRVHCLRKSDLLSLERGSVGWGGNGGFQALNLALQIACWRPEVVGLVGFDMSVAGGEHWHGAHPPGMNNPTARNTERWRRVLDAQAALLAVMGVRVVVCTSSALQNYERLSLATLLEDRNGGRSVQHRKGRSRRDGAGQRGKSGRAAAEGKRGRGHAARPR